MRPAVYFPALKIGETIIPAFLAADVQAPPQKDADKVTTKSSLRIEEPCARSSHCRPTCRPLAIEA